MSPTNVHVNISENQQQKLKHAVYTNSPVSIRLGYEYLCGSDVLALTNSQLNRITKAFQNGKGIAIKMSEHQVEKRGQIPFDVTVAGLAAKALPFLAKTVLPNLATRALSGAGSVLAQKATNKAMGNGLYLKKDSNIARVESAGQGLYLKPYRGSGLGMVGDGLYLKQGVGLLVAMVFLLVQILR